MTTTSSFTSTVATLGVFVAGSLIDCVLVTGTSVVWWILKASGERHGLWRDLASELAEARSKHSVERREWVDEVGECLQRRAQFDGEHQLSQDLARSRAHERRANQDTTLPVGDELDR